MFIWVETCIFTVYILNRCAHKVLRDKTLEEAFIGEKVDFSPFWVFGSSIYIHFLEKKRLKLGPFRLKGILVGYSKSYKAYKVYVRPQWKIVVSRDVNFDEDAWSFES
jgi:hypothetical protein